MRGSKQRDDLVDQAEIVLGENAEGIADDVIEVGFGQVEVDVPGLLLRARLVEARAREERRLGGIVT